MKIIYLTSEDWAFLTHRLPMALAAKQAGFEVHVATRCSGREGEIEALGFKVHRLNFNRGSLSPFGFLKEIFEIYSLFKVLKPDIAHCIAVKPIIAGGLAGYFMPQLKFIHALTGLGSALTAKSFFSKIILVLLGIVLKQKNATTLFQNKDDFTMITTRFNLKKPALIRGSGIDVAHFHTFSQPLGVVKIGLAARMLKSKGIEDAVAASHLLSAKGIQHELHLAGLPDTFNPESLTQETYNGLAAQNIKLLGHIKDVREVWKECAIALLPQRDREGLPKSLLEAASCGRAIVTTDVPGCREIIEAGVNGFIVSPSSPQELAIALEKLILNETLRETMGAASRHFVQSDLSAEAVGKAIIEVYKNA